MVAKRLERDIDIAILISFDGERYRLSLASKDRIDVGELGRNLLNIAGGRGGGRRGWFMGYIENIEAAEDYLNEYFSEL
jgi:alanyl-tRNA synthetase